ncbi:hypothetical protein CMUS01_16310 [Colletotrichum musicola]|uniref:Uncharacterized protein n=1 Tax=Colletotrichum musicola TaxID=2175873 RepID=A0A8H6MJU4_9PEZI|nr:hypothetical protein CMUS01_16310 [Colletotrichum musicola]
MAPISLHVPDNIGGVDVPNPPRTQPDTYDQDLTSAIMTAYILNVTFVQPKRMIKLNPKVTKRGRTVPNVNVDRSQACDSHWAYVYGNEHTDRNACDKCRKGTGLYTECVSFAGLPCSNCNYASAGRDCSLVYKPVSSSSVRSTPTKSGRIRKSRKDAVPYKKLQEQLAAIPTDALRTLADIFDQTADARDAEEMEAEET